MKDNYWLCNKYILLTLITISIIVGFGIGFYTQTLLVSEASNSENLTTPCPEPTPCPECPPTQYIMVQTEEKIGDKIIKEYGDYDVQILKEQAEKIIHKHECYKQDYNISGLDKWEDRLYGMEKNLRLVYDQDEEFHGWLTFNLLRIKPPYVATDTIKLWVDVATKEVSCEIANLTYTKKEFD